jgi:hypothetical protein
MKDFFKWLLRNTAIGIFWIFLLSITVEGRTIFSYANNTLVQNDFVRMVDEDLSDLWRKVYSTAKVTFNEMSKNEDKG